MRAAVAGRAGGPEQLTVHDVPTPEPGPGEILIRVQACGVCYHDVLHRSGRLPGSHFPAVLGHEVAGEVVETVAADTTAPRPGSRIVVYPRIFCGACDGCIRGRQDLCARSDFIGTTRDGGYGEYIVVPVRNVVTVPPNVDPSAAALAACPIGTSIRALEGRARVRLGETVLIIGAGGGLGLHQIQIAKLMGATVLAVSTSHSKVTGLREAGADEVFIAEQGRFSSEVWNWTGRQGVDVVIENVVTGTFGESVRALRVGGRMVVLGNIDVENVELNPGLIITRRATIMGSGNSTVAELLKAVALLSSGAVRARVGRVLPFDDAGEAHRLVETRAVEGRVVLSGWREE